jgi:hypothetical protein
MRNIVDKIETHILYSIMPAKNHAIHEIMQKNTLGPDRPQMTIIIKRRKDVICMPVN